MTATKFVTALDRNDFYSERRLTALLYSTAEVVCSFTSEQFYGSLLRVIGYDTEDAYARAHYQSDRLSSGLIGGGVFDDEAEARKQLALFF